MFRNAAFFLGMVILSCAPLAAQQGVPSALTVNGTHMPPSVMIGATDSDVAVQVSPILRATGAKVKSNGSYVEALWDDNTSLVLEVGRDTCTYAGQTMKLNTPCGMLDNDLVMPLRDLCGIIGARLEPAPGGSWMMFRSVVVDDGAPAYGPAAATGQRFPEAGRGGLTSKVDHIQTPYDRPEVSVATIGTTNYTLETPRMPENIAPLYKKSGVVNAANPNGGLGVDQFGIPVGMSAGMGGYQGGMGSNTYPGTAPAIASPAELGTGRYGLNSGMGNLAVPVMGNNLGGYNRSSIAPGMFSAPGAGGTPGMGNTALPPNLLGPNGGMNAGTAAEGVRYYDAPAASENAMLPGDVSKKGESANLSPAKIVISGLDIQRLMSFHLTSYEIHARIKNEGGTTADYPIMLQLMAKSKRYDHYDLLESYVIDPLKPGTEVEVVKKVDGHQFPCLVDIRVEFKVSVLESKPAASNKSARLRKEQLAENARNPGSERDEERHYKETCSKTRTMHY